MSNYNPTSDQIGHLINTIEQLVKEVKSLREDNAKQSKTLLSARRKIFIGYALIVIALGGFWQTHLALNEFKKQRTSYRVAVCKSENNNSIKQAKVLNTLLDDFFPANTPPQYVAIRDKSRVQIADAYKQNDCSASAVNKR